MVGQPLRQHRSKIRYDSYRLAVGEKSSVPEKRSLKSTKMWSTVAGLVEGCNICNREELQCLTPFHVICRWLWLKLIVRSLKFHKIAPKVWSQLAPRTSSNSSQEITYKLSQKWRLSFLQDHTFAIFFVLRIQFPMLSTSITMVNITFHFDRRDLDSRTNHFQEGEDDGVHHVQLNLE